MSHYISVPRAFITKQVRDNEVIFDNGSAAIFTNSHIFTLKEVDISSLALRDDVFYKPARCLNKKTIPIDNIKYFKKEPEFKEDDHQYYFIDGKIYEVFITKENNLKSTGTTIKVRSKY